MQLFDICVNLTTDRFDKDRHETLERALEAGVSAMMITGADSDSSERALALAQAYPEHLRSTAGVHPHMAQYYTEATRASLQALSQQPQTVRAMGEMGLDFNRDASPRADQERAFSEQLELAVEAQLPVFLHERDAHERFLAILKDYWDHLPQGVVHCFTGEREALFNYLDMDLHIGVTGWICDERRGGHVYELLPNIPAHRFMIETDAPYLLPRDLAEKPRNRRNEPMYLPHVAETAARARGTGVETLAAETTATARRFFGFSEAAD